MDDERFAVLNAVALKKMATAAAITNATGTPIATVRSILGALADDGQVAVVGEQALPTDDAEPALRSEADDRYGALRAAAGDLHERFEQLNGRFLTAMSSWQQLDVGGRKVANAHDDPAYDERVIATLARLVDRLTPLLDVLASHDARFARYGARLRRAIDRVQEGELEAVSSPLVDSVHNVWFEFHEDLLRTLGEERRE